MTPLPRPYAAQAQAQAATRHRAPTIRRFPSLRALARALLQYHVLERDLATKRLIELALVLDILHPKRCT
jgi:hypothetical protein